MTSRPARHRFFENRITRDARVPLSDDVRKMEFGWRCIPIRPTNDESWFIVDTSHDRTTKWGRWHEVEGRA